MGSLLNIWIKRSKKGNMDNVNSAELVENQGIRDNADQNGKRQVTIIAMENWQDMMKTLKTSLDPSSRRANLLIGGIELKNSRGRILNIGECCVKIYGETRPCERMDEAFSGLRKAMEPNWNGGVFGIIIKGGTIQKGDKVYFD